jgi:uncharacterized protein
MQFSVNYSPILAELVLEGAVRLDCFKCPAWPELLENAARVLPVYIHYPLAVGAGQGHPIDTETNQPADLDHFAALRDQTGKPLINTHFIPSGKDYPGIEQDSMNPADIQRVLDGTLRDLEPVIRRFGVENVMVENVVNEHGWLTMAVMPEVLAALLDRSGCAFLFDHSHARLAARNLGMDERNYCSALPVDRMREVHITGLQMLEGELLDRLFAADPGNRFITGWAGGMMDHLPMAEADWPELDWLLAQIQRGQTGESRWATPWVIASEVGGVGGFWEAVADRQSYLEQVPRMHRMIKGEGGAR